MAGLPLKPPRYICSTPGKVSTTLDLILLKVSVEVQVKFLLLTGVRFKAASTPLTSVKPELTTALVAPEAGEI